MSGSLRGRTSEVMTQLNTSQGEEVRGEEVRASIATGVGSTSRVPEGVMTIEVPPEGKGF